MSNEIVTQASPEMMEIIRRQQAAMAEAANFNAVSKSGDWRERLQLCGSASKVVKKRKIEPGKYAIMRSEDDFDDLGMSVDVMVLAWRPLALDMSGETPVPCYKQDSPMFDDIKHRSTLPDSSCTYGPEFLLWVPVAKKFVGFHMGSKSARGESPKMLAILTTTGAATLTHTIAESKKYSWEVPVINPCTTPLAMPNIADLQKEMDKWEKERTSSDAPEIATTSKRER